MSSAGEPGAAAGEEAQPAAQPGPADAPSDIPAAQPMNQQKPEQQTGEEEAGGSSNKKRKVAMYLAYVGHGYQGMQRNPGAKTIEDEMFRALHAAGAISDANAEGDGFVKIHWMRAARTDKGVSAVGQVVSFKMMLQPDGMLQRINAALPGQIRVFGYTRATNGFDARKHCDKRRYEYILPEWAFDPSKGHGRAAALRAERAAAAGKDGGGAGAAGEAEGQQQQQEQQGGAEPAGAAEEQAAAADGQDGSSSAQAGAPQQPAADGAATEAAAADGAAIEPAAAGEAPSEPAAAEGQAFVFDEVCKQRMSAILRNFEGTHSFHNFTVRKTSAAPDVKRYILSFKCQGVFEIGGERWVKLVVVGQSFMLHQIRKMVGMAVAVMRGVAPESSLQLALKTSYDINTPMAPELGLFLDECFFDAYNKQWGELHGQLRQSDYAAEVAAFKGNELYPHIAARDREEGVNAAWLPTLNEAAYRFSQWEQQIADIQANGGRRPSLPRGSGAAAMIGGMETYGQDDQQQQQQHKRPGSGGGGPAKRSRGGFGGREGRVLGPRPQRPGARGGRGGLSAEELASGEFSE